MTRDADPDAGAAEPEPDSGPIRLDATAEAGTGCIPRYLGCDDRYPGVDPTTLCGQIDDGCGNTIECDPTGVNCTGMDVACNDPLRPNQCGCSAGSCDDAVPGGAECGTLTVCGATLDCGACPGAQDVCTEAFKCECAPNLQACDGKVCGTRPDGCGAQLPCGPRMGQCQVGDCSADQTACVCPDKASACGASSGPLTLRNGCTYDCGSGCVPDNRAACAGAECGTATNHCGDVVQCGPKGGACGPGASCADTRFVVGTSVPPRSNAYLGGLCLDEAKAAMIGQYAVRTHAFRRGGNSTTSSLSRAEALSLVTIVLDAPRGTLRMTDLGCSARTTSEPGGLEVTTLAPSYANLPPVEVELTLRPGAGSKMTWLRPIVSTPTGFTPGMPSYCVGFEGAKVALPAADPRRGKWFERDRCTCPTARMALDKPASTSGRASQDCRVTDADGDGAPGFTVVAKSAPFAAGTLLYNATISEIAWRGEVVASGYHTAVAVEPSPIRRSLVGCEPKGVFGPTLCSTAEGSATGTFDCACGSEGEYNLIQFVPVDQVRAPRGAWDCAAVVDQSATLFASFGTCSDKVPCPSGSLCRANACWPATTSGACSEGREPCPDDMVCRADRACWPPTGGAQNQCPSGVGCSSF